MGQGEAGRGNYKIIVGEDIEIDGPRLPSAVFRRPTQLLFYRLQGVQKLKRLEARVYLESTVEIIGLGSIVGRQRGKFIQRRLRGKFDILVST